MLWFILIPGLIFLGVLIFNVFDGDGFLAGLGWGALTGVFFGGILAVFINLMVGLGLEHVTQDGTTHNQLVSLSTGSQIQGQFSHAFFVGYGYIDQHIVYNYYVKNDDGTYSLKTRNASNTKIRQTDDGQHVIDCKNYYYEIKHPWLSFLAGEHYFDHADCVLTIPAGSIKQTFNPNP